MGFLMVSSLPDGVVVAAGNPRVHAASSDGTDLLVNSGFEDGFDGWDYNGDPAGAKTQIDTAIALSGSKSLRITFDGSADVDYWHIGQGIPVEPDTAYRLQGYMRVSGIRDFPGVVLGVTDGRGWDFLGRTTPDMYTTQDWTRVSTITFTTLADTSSLRVYVGRGGMGGDFPIRGTVWLDDIALVRLAPFITPSALSMRIGDTQTVDAGNGDPPFRWTSSDPAVAAVQPAGETGQAQVTALSAGEASIMAVDAGGRSAQITLTSIDRTSITVHAGHVLREVPEAMFGSNVGYWETGYDNWPDWGDVIADPVFIADVAGLGLTSLRYPGGTQSNYYDFSLGKGWVDGFGVSERHNVAGINTDQFVKFLRATGISGAMITANVYKSGDKNWPGDNWISSQVAADWVDHLNHKSGFRVEYWELGNEIYSNGELPWDTNPQVPGLTRDLYIRKIHEWSQAMKAVDPAIQIGVSLQSPNLKGGAEEWWDLPIIQDAAGDFDFLIVHPYVFTDNMMVNGTFADSTAREAYAWIWATNPIANLRRWLDTYAPAGPEATEIQASEWAVGDWAEALPSNDMLFKAVLETDFLWDMVLEGADGANITGLCGGSPYELLEPVSGGRKFAQYYMMWMNRRRSGKWLVESRVASPTYSADLLDGWESHGRVDGVPYLSVYATKSEDGNHLYLIVTNKNSGSLTAGISLDGFMLDAHASVWQMTSAKWDDTGIRPMTWTVDNASSAFDFTFAARSVTSIVLDSRNVATEATNITALPTTGVEITPAAAVSPMPPGGRGGICTGLALPMVLVTIAGATGAARRGRRLIHTCRNK